MTEDPKTTAPNVNIPPKVTSKRKPTTGERKVTSLRLSELAVERLEALAVQADLSPPKVVERLISRAYQDPDGYYIRLSAYHSIISAATSLAVASIGRPDLPDTIFQHLAPVLSRIVGPLPPPPNIDDLEMPSEEAALRLLVALTGLARGPIS